MSARTVSINDFRLISVYPRRPKIAYPENGIIILKFNSSVIHAAQNSNQLGVPTFAGIPVISSLEDFNYDVLCKWFRFRETEEQISDIEYKLDLKGNVLEKDASSYVEGPLKDEFLINTIFDFPTISNWENGIDRIRTIRRHSALGYDGNTTYRGFSMWMGGYKPFYLILKE